MQEYEKFAVFFGENLLMDVIRKSWKYWKKIRPQLIIIVVFALMQIAISLIVPQITQLIIDRVITPVLDPEREMAAASS